MKTFNVMVDIDASAQRVFRALSDVEKWPDWTPTVQSVRRLDSGPFTVGSRARIVQPKIRPAVWQVSAMDADANFTWVSKSPGLRLEAGHTVQPAGAGCRVSLTFEITGALSSIAGLIFGRTIAEYVTTEAQALKKHCES